MVVLAILWYFQEVIQSVVVTCCRFSSEVARRNFILESLVPRENTAKRIGREEKENGTCNTHHGRIFNSLDTRQKLSSRWF